MISDRRWRGNQLNECVDELVRLAGLDADGFKGKRCSDRFARRLGSPNFKGLKQFLLPRLYGRATTRPPSAAAHAASPPPHPLPGDQSCDSAPSFPPKSKQPRMPQHKLQPNDLRFR